MRILELGKNCAKKFAPLAMRFAKICEQNDTNYRLCGPGNTVICQTISFSTLISSPLLKTDLQIILAVIAEEIETQVS